MPTLESLQTEVDSLTLRVKALETAVDDIRAVNLGQDTTIRQSILKVEQLINSLSRQVTDLKQALITHLG